jgi:hypothetical protein
MPPADFLNLYCNILEQNAGPDDQDAGGAPVREPYSVAQALVPCAVDELGGDAKAKDGKASQTGRVRVYFDPELLEVTPTTRHRVEVLDDTGRDVTRHLVVESVNNPMNLDRLVYVEGTEQVV